MERKERNLDMGEGGAAYMEMKLGKGKKNQ